MALSPRHTFAGIAVLLVVGCGSLNTVRYYTPTIQSTIASVRASDGLAFITGTMCVYISGNKYIQPRAMTLLGVPLLPVSLQTNKRTPGFFDVYIWLVPAHDASGYMVDPRRVEMQFDDGAKVAASTIQVSRFDTEMDEQFGETIVFPEHWGAKPLEEFAGPLELWDWTRLTVRFRKPSSTSEPASVLLDGLVQGDVNQEVPTVALAYSSETRAAFPGRFADGNWMSDSPDKACRRLQANEP